MTAGYSGTPLPRKLGIKASHRLLILAPPPGYPDALGELPDAVSISLTPDGQPHDVILFFVDSRAELAAALPQLRGWMHDRSALWLGWPKKASKIPTDIDGNVVRTLGLDTGLVDNKVCAIDESWSGLRFVVRVADRKKKKA